MSLVEWKDEFNLGIEEVDIEHRNLVALINALHEAMLAGASRADIVEGITQIYTLVSTQWLTPSIKKTMRCYWTTCERYWTRFGPEGVTPKSGYPTICSTGFQSTFARTTPACINTLSVRSVPAGSLSKRNGRRDT
jgi:hypothetical protein